MDAHIIALVLGAALLHAAWNAMIKTAGDALLRLALINLTGGLVALPLLLLAPAPPAAALPWLAASVLAHHAYYLLLVAAYRHGDLSLVYPIARGSAPLLVAGGGWLLAAEALSPLGLLAIAIICAAILSLAAARPPAGAERGDASRRGSWLALATGASIAAYTVFDGLGVRASTPTSEPSALHALGYIGWLLALDALPMAVLAAARRGRALGAALAAGWRAGLVGGALSAAAYGAVIWAMASQPMALVSALRETSVIIAAAIGVFLLKEPLGARRLLAATVVAGGVILLQLDGQ